jgi:ArsR family transcriptional regulator
MEKQDALAALAALAQETRLDVFRLLVQAGPEGLAAGALSERLGIAPPTLSFHLKELRSAGLVRQEREGRSLLYAPDFGAMTALVAYLTENCCAGACRA